MTNQIYSSYCAEDRYYSCLSFVPPSKGGCNCDCHYSNKEENKKYSFSHTVVDYNDDYAEQTILLDFHRSAGKAQGLIYQKMIAAKKSYPKSAKVANEEKEVGEEEEA